MKLKIIAILIVFSLQTANSYWEEVTNMPDLYRQSYWLDVYFLESNPQYGWVCGYEGKVIRTTDGGHSWQGTQIAEIDQIESIHFVSPFVGYCSGEGKIFKSINGGASWVNISPRADDVLLWGTYFLDENLGFVIGGNCVGYQKFFKTTNGGQNWTSYDFFYPNTKLADCIVYPDGTGYAVSSGVVWRTTNMGTSWSVFSRTGGLDWHEEIAHKGRSFLVPYSLSCDGTTTNRGGIRFSTNMGGNWRDYVTNGSMYGSFLLDSLRGWACGLNREAYYTSDGGKTWELRNCGIPPGKNLDDIWFVDDTTGWLAGEGLYRLRRSSIPQPNILLLGQNEICEGDTVELVVEGNYKKIRWSTGETTKSIKVHKSGKYNVYVENSECEYAYSGEIEIIVRQADKIVLQPSKSTPCDGDTVLLKVISNHSNIRWSNGETGTEILLTKSEKIKVVAEDAFGCVDTLDYAIVFNPLPEPKIIPLGRTNVCIGDSVLLQVVPDFPVVEWFDEQGRQVASGQFLKVGESGKFMATVVDKNGCGGTTEPIEITVRHETNRLTVLLSGKEFFVDSVHYPELSCSKIKIKNISQLNYTIDNPYLFYKLSFSIPQSQLPIFIAAGEEREIAVCYSPRSLNFERDTLIIEDVCNDHIIPLVAFSVPNKYYGDTRCDASLLLETVKINSGNNFVVASPYPNPASKIVYIPYSKVKSTQMLKTDVFDVLGNQIASGKEVVKEQLEIDGTEIEQGIIEIDTSGLKSGMYFAVVKSNTKVEKIKFIIQQ